MLPCTPSHTARCQGCLASLLPAAQQSPSKTPVSASKTPKPRKANGQTRNIEGASGEDDDYEVDLIGAVSGFGSAAVVNAPNGNTGLNVAALAGGGGFGAVLIAAAVAFIVFRTRSARNARAHETVAAAIAAAHAPAAAPAGNVSDDSDLESAQPVSTRAVDL